MIWNFGRGRFGTLQAGVLLVAAPALVGTLLVLATPPFGLDAFGLVGLACGVPAAVMAARGVLRDGPFNAPLGQWAVLGVALGESSILWGVLLGIVILLVAVAIHLIELWLPGLF